MSGEGHGAEGVQDAGARDAPGETVEQERLEVARQPALLMFFAFLFLQLPAALLQFVDVGFGLIFAGVFFLALPAVLWVILAGFDPRQFLSLQRVRGRLLIGGAAVGLANFFCAGVLQFAVRRYVKTEIDVSTLFSGASGPELGLIVLAVGISAPVCEEIAFRGYLQRVFSARYRSFTAIFLTAVLFSAMHLDPGGFLARVELGCVFGLLAMWSGSIFPSMAAHAANNLTASALFVASATSEPSATSPAAQSSATALFVTIGGGVLSAIATAFLLRNFRQIAAVYGVPSPLPRATPGGTARVKGPLLKTLGVAFAALAIFAVADRTAIRFAWTDMLVTAQFQPKELERRIPDEATRKKVLERLRNARKRARRGEVPPERYVALRKELWGPKDNALPPLTPAQIETAFGQFETGAAPVPEVAAPDAGSLPQGIAP